jgi:pimeloyl-ACP methyl ester carboxylesterase
VREADALALALNAVPAAQQPALIEQFLTDSGCATWQLAFGEVATPRAPRCPVLVVGAGRDRLTPPDLQRRIARRYSAEYIEAPAHGHMLPVEPDWQRPIGRVLAWLQAAVPSERGVPVVS